MFLKMITSGHFYSVISKLYFWKCPTGLEIFINNIYKNLQTCGHFQNYSFLIIIIQKLLCIRYTENGDILLKGELNWKQKLLLYRWKIILVGIWNWKFQDIELSLLRNWAWNVPNTPPFSCHNLCSLMSLDLENAMCSWFYCIRMNLFLQK